MHDYQKGPVVAVKPPVFSQYDELLQKGRYMHRTHILNGRVPKKAPPPDYRCAAGWIASGSEWAADYL
jgi:hypothetical protein